MIPSVEFAGQRRFLDFADENVFDIGSLRHDLHDQLLLGLGLLKLFYEVASLHAVAVAFANVTKQFVALSIQRD